MNQRERSAIFAGISKAVCGAKMGCLGEYLETLRAAVSGSWLCKVTGGPLRMSSLAWHCLRSGEKEARREEEDVFIP